MTSNLDRYERDLNLLIELGGKLRISMYAKHRPEWTELVSEENFDAEAKEALASLPPFNETYQRWYSEAMALIRQLLPDRLQDFVQHYNKPKARKNITFENYRIEDCLQGLAMVRGRDDKRVVGPEAAIPHFEQQLSILVRRGKALQPSGCETRPANCRSSRKQSERFMEATRWTEALR